MFQRETRKPRLRLLADTASTAPRGAGQSRARRAQRAPPATPTGRHAAGDPAMDLILPDHLREPGHRVPRDDPPHDIRPIAPTASAAGVQPATASLHRTARRAPVCGLRDWRTAARSATSPDASVSPARR
jgi:hypothetical protein